MPPGANGINRPTKIFSRGDPDGVSKLNFNPDVVKLTPAETEVMTKLRFSLRIRLESHPADRLSSRRPAHSWACS